MTTVSTRSLSTTHAMGVLVLILGVANLYLHSRISSLQTQVNNMAGSQGPSRILTNRIAEMEEADAKLVESLNSALRSVSQSKPQFKSQSKPNAAPEAAPVGASLGAETGPADDDYNVRYPTRMVVPADDSPYGEYKVVPLNHA